jgi:predicted MFS family arabinose efflux permease
MMAEELMRSFLPGHSRSLVDAGSAHADLLGSLPLVVFLTVVAILQIPLSVASRRIGRLEGFALGGMISAVGYMISAYTDSLWVFIFSRLLSAIGFSLVFVSAQGQVIDASTKQDRASSLAIFIRAILVAGLCGPPLGGMFADRWGIRATLLICAVLSLLAMLAATMSMPRRKPTVAAAVDFGLTDLRDAWKTPGVQGMLLGCAFPAKLLLTGLCFYLVPLGLQQQGYSSSEIGRLLMIYPLMMVLAVPGFALLADRLSQRRRFVIVGGLIAGSCTLIAIASTAPWWVAAMLLLLGIGQAMSITPQSAIMADLASNMNGKQVASVMGLFRLIERSGSAVGPALGAVLLGGLGFGAAVGAFGAVVIAGSLGFALGSRRAER